MCFFRGGGAFCIKGKKTTHPWEAKHFHKYIKYHFWSKSKVRCRVYYLNKNNLRNALNTNKSISGQHSKINMKTLIYILFVAAKIINLLANVTVSQKYYFLILMLWLTRENDLLGMENSTAAAWYPSHPTARVLNNNLENSFHKKNKTTVHPASHSGKHEFGLAWTLVMIARHL